MDEACEALRGAAPALLPDACEHLCVKRLWQPSPDGKAAVLRLVKYCCLKPGMAAFRQALHDKRVLDPVRVHMKHKGPPDALRGDRPHQLVRELAAQALQALQVTEQQVASLRGQVSTQGFGSTSAAGAAGGGGEAAAAGTAAAEAGGSKMVGFGNPAFENGKGPAAAPQPHRFSMGAGRGPTLATAAPTGSARPVFEVARAGPAVFRKATMTTDAQAAIDDFCSVGGIGRHKISGEDVKLFVQTVSESDAAEAVPALREKLGAASGQVVNRALVGLHSLLVKGSSPTCALIADSFEKVGGPARGSRAAAAPPPPPATPSCHPLVRGLT